MNHTEILLGNEKRYMCKVISAPLLGLDWIYKGEADFSYQFFISITYT
jgi:hypothetical protein